MSEREKFEQYWCAKYGCSNDDYWFEDGIYGDPDMQAAWETWQAATAQAVPEGFVVVPVEPTGAMENKILWAVNIPEEPDSEELLFAATSKEHAQSIVSRLHNEIFETYPTLGEPIADSIYVTEWQEGAEEHVESLATKWWEVISFVGSE